METYDNRILLPLDEETINPRQLDSVGEFISKLPTPQAYSKEITTFYTYHSSSKSEAQFYESASYNFFQK